MDCRGFPVKPSFELKTAVRISSIMSAKLTSGFGLIGLAAISLIAVAASNFIGCSVEDKQADTKKIEIDGSSTVYPVSFAVVEEYEKTHPDITITVSQTGTGAGFERFSRGETVISDASRPIKPKEIEACKANGISYVELQIAIDGLTVVVNSENDWCDALTVAQLKKIWEKDSKVTKWSDVNPEWPKEEIKLFGPGTESGTYDYFVEEICGKEIGSRSDYEYSSKDNVLVEGIAGEKYALGYFGYAYYAENKERLKALAISPTDNLEDAVAPTGETVESGQYKPLSRPLFIYVKKEALTRPEVVEFVEFYLSKGQDYVKQVQYVPLRQEVLDEMKQRFEDARASESGSESKPAAEEPAKDPETSGKSTTE